MKRNHSGIKEILRLVDKWRMFILFSIGGLLGEFIFIMVISYGRKISIDAIVSNKELLFVSGLLLYTFGCLMSTASVMLFDYMALKIPKKMPYSERYTLLRTILTGHKKYRDNQISSADLLFRINDDIDEVSDIYEELFLLISCLGRSLGAVTIGAMISWKLDFLIILLGVLYYIIQKYKIGPMYDFMQKASAFEEKYFARFQDAIKNHLWIRIMINPSRFNDRLASLNKEYKAVNNECGKTNAWISVLSSGCYAIIMIVLIALGVYFVISNELSIGGLVAFLGIQGSLVDPLRYMGNFIEKYSKALSSYDRLLAVKTQFEIPMGADNPLHAFEKQSHPKDNIPFCIRLENISFSYIEDNEIVRSLSYNAESGQIHFIVGPSGCGKTTLLKLISQQLKPLSGSIYKYKNGERLSIRSNEISYITQSPFCFDGTIAENITFQSENIDYEKMMLAAEKAEILTFINTCPERFDFKLIDNGKNISLGQKMRVCMARAFYRDTSIWLLDEIFASLDKATADKLLDFIIRRTRDGICVFFVTHRHDWIPSGSYVLDMANI